MTKYFSINERGFSVRCKLYCADEKRITGAVIYGHGFSGNKDNKIAEKTAERLQKRHPGTALIIFNWPCHGDDARNKLILSDCLDYLDIVIGYVGKRYHTNELCACANSFGGYVFLTYLASRGDPFKRIVLRCPAVDMYSVLTRSVMTDDDLRALKKGKPVQVGFDRKVKVTPEFVEALRDNDLTKNDYHAYANDIAIFHGEKDEIVPIDSVRAFADSSGIAFIPVRTADHRFSDPAVTDAFIADMIGFFFD